MRETSRRSAKRIFPCNTEIEEVGLEPLSSVVKQARWWIWDRRSNPREVQGKPESRGRGVRNRTEWEPEREVERLLTEAKTRRWRRFPQAGEMQTPRADQTVHLRFDFETGSKFSKTFSTCSCSDKNKLHTGSVGLGFTV